MCKRLSVKMVAGVALDRAAAAGRDLAWRVQLGLCSEVPVYSVPLHCLL